MGFIKKWLFRRKVVQELQKKLFASEMDLALYNTRHIPEVEQKGKEAEGELIAAQKIIKGMDSHKRKEFKPKVNEKEEAFKGWNAALVKTKHERDQKEAVVRGTIKNIEFYSNYKI